MDAVYDWWKIDEEADVVMVPVVVDAVDVLVRQAVGPVHVPADVPVPGKVFTFPFIIRWKSNWFLCCDFICVRNVGVCTPFECFTKMQCQNFHFIPCPNEVNRIQLSDHHTAAQSHAADPNHGVTAANPNHQQRIHVPDRDQSKFFFSSALCLLVFLVKNEN